MSEGCAGGPEHTQSDMIDIAVDLEEAKMILNEAKYCWPIPVENAVGKIDRRAESTREVKYISLYALYGAPPVCW